MRKNNNKYFCLILIIIFFLLLLGWYIKYDKLYIESYFNKIYFIDSNDLFNILKEDNNKYFYTFNKYDLYARKINNINDYNNNIKISVADFNKEERDKIKKCIDSIDLILLKIDLEWFNGKKAYKIPWKIGCIKGKLYESGLPHTRNDIIIVSKDNVNNYSMKKLMKTFMHEKVHIYQKLFKDDVEKYIKINNFIKIKQRSKEDNIRANPDLDNWVYKDNKNNIYRAVYNTNPSSVEDIIYMPQNSQSFEHPFEKMAIYIENNYV